MMYFLELCFARYFSPQFGAAMVFNVGASTGGTDIVAYDPAQIHKP